MRLKNRQARKYCRLVRSFLPCSAKQRSLILGEIKSNLSAYLEENHSASFKEIESRFGTPRQIAVAHVEEMGTEELLKQLRVRKRIFAVISAAVVLALLIWASAVTANYIDCQKTDNGYYEVTIY